jgi:hypothetical protein
MSRAYASQQILLRVNAKHWPVVGTSVHAPSLRILVYSRLPVSLSKCHPPAIKRRARKKIPFNVNSGHRRSTRARMHPISLRGRPIATVNDLLVCGIRAVAVNTEKLVLGYVHA